MKTLQLHILATLTFFMTANSLFAETLKIVSPQKKTVATVDVDKEITYTLTFDGAKVLESSKLGMTFKGVDTLTDLKVVDVKTKSIDETWAQPLGKQAQYHDQCTETTIALQDTASHKLSVIFRAYDDGFAFRYLVPESSGLTDANDEFCVESEETEFAFGADCDAWATVYKQYNTSQEEEFNKCKLSDIKPDSFIGMPLIVKGQDFIAALTESDLLDWSGAQFAASANTPNAIKIRLTPRKDGRGAVVRKDAATSPWRVILLGKRPVDLVNNSGVILNTATPCLLEDASWVQPGNCSWNWWAPKGGVLNNETIDGLTDLSADMCWQYTLVDAGWSQTKKYGEDGNAALTYRPTMNIPASVEYAKQKGVRIIVWFHHTDLNAIGIRRALKQCADWGVAGVKIDFMDSHDQEMVQWIEEVLKVAAEYKILVDYHGMYKPTGLERTYPHQITREGVRGNEYNRWDRETAKHTVTLPYTRCMLGPADYTPGGFRNVHGNEFKSLNAYEAQSETCRVIGTRAHELALCMLYDSPLRCLCDLPQNYVGQPGLDYLRNLPSVWDETIALDGEIGEYYVAARRSNDTWYVSGITNEEARTFSLKLDFLADGEYEGTLYADAPESDADATKIAISTKNYQKDSTLEIAAVREGGWNLVLIKK